MDRIPILLEALEKNSSDAFLIHALALEYVKQEKVSKGIVYFEKNIAINTEYLPTYYALGKAYEMQQRIEEAKHTYEQGITIASQQNDIKTRGELTTALWILEDE